MTSDQIILFALFAAVFGMLLWGRYRYDIVAFGTLLIGVVLGVVPTKDAFSGFGHPATIVVALVLVVSAGLVRSEKTGRTRILHIEAAPLAEAEDWLARQRRLWEGRLDRLQALAEALERPKT